MYGARRSGSGTTPTVLVVAGAVVSGATAHHRPALRVPRLAVLAVFFANGVVIGTWVVRIPAVQQRLGLGEGLLGLALLGAAVGALAAMPLVGALVTRFGSRHVVGTTAFLLSLSLVTPALAPNLFLLVPALMLLGAANGGLDVSMNAQAVVVERGYGRPIMSSFHAAWSFGGLAGAALGGLLASLGVGALPHFSVVAILAAIGFVGAYGALLPSHADASEEGAPAFSPVRRGLSSGLGSSRSVSSSGRARWETGAPST
jgi:MFS family permease